MIPTTPASESDSPLQFALDLAAEVAACYEISAPSSLLAGARSWEREGDISVAVLGRFKAGKSSFLKHFLGRALFITQRRHGLHAGRSPCRAIAGAQSHQRQQRNGPAQS